MKRPESLGKERERKEASERDVKRPEPARKGMVRTGQVAKRTAGRSGPIRKNETVGRVAALREEARTVWEQDQTVPEMESSSATPTPDDIDRELRSFKELCVTVERHQYADCQRRYAQVTRGLNFLLWKFFLGYLGFALSFCFFGYRFLEGGGSFSQLSLFLLIPILVLVPCFCMVQKEVRERDRYFKLREAARARLRLANLAASLDAGKLRGEMMLRYCDALAQRCDT